MPWPGVGGIVGVRMRAKASSRSGPTVGAAWRSRKGLFRLVSLDDAERLTGRSVAELRKIHGVQTVTRIFADGSRQEALRVPRELVVDDS
jgi:hypothetical protein